MGTDGGGLAESSRSVPAGKGLFWFKLPCSTAAVTQSLRKHWFNFGTLIFNGLGFLRLLSRSARLTKCFSPTLSVTKDVSCAGFVSIWVNTCFWDNSVSQYCSVRLGQGFIRCHGPGRLL